MSLLSSTFWQRIRRRAQTIISGGGSGGSGGGSGEYDTDANAFFLVNTGLDATQKTAVNVLVLGLKSAGLWGRMRAIYPFVGGTADSHKWNLKDPRDLDLAKRLVFVGGVTHSANGIKPNGSTGYAKTFFDAHEECPQYSFHGSYYSRENVAPGSGDLSLFGGRYTGTAVNLEFYSTNRIYADVSGVNNAGSPLGLTITGQTNFKGLFTLSCLQNTYFKVFRDSTQVGSQSTNRFGYFPNMDPSSDNGKFYLGAYNNNETPLYFSSYECGYSSLGWGLNDSQVAAYNTLVTNYLTALNRL